MTRRCLLLFLLLLLAGSGWALELKPKVTYNNSPVARGKKAKITVRTAPGAKCKIAVKLASGLSQAKGLVPKTADKEGVVRWEWDVRRVAPGKYPVTIRARHGDKVLMTKTTLTVVPAKKSTTKKK